MFLNYQHILNLFFPQSEDEKRTTTHTTASFAKKYAPTTDNGVTTLLSFKDADVRSAIHLAKFHNNTHAKKLLSHVLKKHLSERYLQPHTFLLIPVPLSKARQHKRGYNQVTEIIRLALMPSENFTLSIDILYKVIDNPSQTSLNRTERITNASNCYKATNTAHEKHLILIDDVTTTGATLDASKKALMSQRPASVHVVALAG
jgi:ComF family protein